MCLVASVSGCQRLVNDDQVGGGCRFEPRRDQPREVGGRLDDPGLGVGLQPVGVGERAGREGGVGPLEQGEELSGVEVHGAKRSTEY